MEDKCSGERKDVMVWMKGSLDTKSDFLLIVLGSKANGEGQV